MGKNIMKMVIGLEISTVVVQLLLKGSTVSIMAEGQDIYLLLTSKTNLLFGMIGNLPPRVTITVQE